MKVVSRLVQVTYGIDFKRIITTTCLLFENVRFDVTLSQNLGENCPILWVKSTFFRICQGRFWEPLSIKKRDKPSYKK